MFLIWVSLHRGLLFAMICVGLWGGANYWYLRYDIKRFIQGRRPHNWIVDMEAKTGKGGRKKPLH